MQMTDFTMPIREYLQTDFNALVNERELDPFEAYTVLIEALGARGLTYDTYAQATITSGGHARVPGLDWLEIVQRNVAYAQGMAKELFQNGQLNPRTTIEASTLGLVKQWKEKDYITFWLNTLAKPDTRARDGMHRTDRLRKIFEKDVDRYDIDFTKFNDYGLSNEERARYYIRYADMAVVAMREFGEFTHVDRLVAVSETSGSLGASTERYFAKKLGGAVYNLAVAHLENFPLDSSSTNPALVRDTSLLVEYGAQVFDTRTASQIILVHESSHL